MSPRRAFDVVVMGGGLAGLLMARQLRRTLPEVSVAIVEPRPGTRRKVGESTVELGAHYLNRRLGLSGLMYREHLPKHGLRFFFDRPDHSVAFPQMSEVGQAGFSHFPSWQLDRQRFEQSLLGMLHDDGVDVFEGFRVRGVEVGSPHRLAIEADGVPTSLTARWVVDATGRRRLLGRQLDLTQPVPDHALASVWARIEGMGEVEGLGDDAWRARWHWATRDLATSHLCRDRAWIWLIPLRDGLTSVGWVGHRDLRTRDMVSRDGLLSFLRQSAALAPLLDRARVVDLGSGHALAHGTRHHVSADRWALIGEAAEFSDPLYSPGTDHIALQNDLTCDLIRRDLQGGDLPPHVARVEAVLQHRFRLTLGIYRGQYPVLASYDLFRLRLMFDLYHYFNHFGAYLHDRHLDPGWQERTLARAPKVEHALARVGDRFASVAAELRAEGRLFEGNRGGWDESLFSSDLQRTLVERTDADEWRLQRWLTTRVLRVLERACTDGWRRPPARGWMRALFDDFELGRRFRPRRGPDGA